MKRKKLVVGTLIVAMLLPIVGETTTSVAFASEVTNVSQKEDKFIPLSDSEMKALGFADKDIENYHRNLQNPIYVKDGMIQNSRERGKFTAAVKAIRKLYSKLPSSVKKYIAAHTGLETLLSFIENATGTLHDAIYNACRKVGMSPTVANIVTAAIMTLVF